MLSSFFKYLREFSSSKYLWQQHSQVHFPFCLSGTGVPSISFPKVGRRLPQQPKNPTKLFRILETSEKTLFKYVNSNWCYKFSDTQQSCCLEWQLAALIFWRVLSFETSTFYLVDFISILTAAAFLELPPVSWCACCSLSEDGRKIAQITCDPDVSWRLTLPGGKARSSRSLCGFAACQCAISCPGTLGLLPHTGSEQPLLELQCQKGVSQSSWNMTEGAP